MQPQGSQQNSGHASSLSQSQTANQKHDPDLSWRDHHANQSLSGIEFRKVKTNELVNFITIKHDEILEKSSSFRIAIIVSDDDNTFTLPPKQTFEEIIQAKRRQQMLLYGAGSSTTNTSALSERAARRVAAMARRQSSLNVAINRQNTRNLNEDTQPTSAPRKSSKSSRSRPSRKSSSRPSSSKNKSSAPSKTAIPKTMPKPIATEAPSTSTASKSPIVNTVIMNTSDDSIASDASNNKMITSMKELARQNPSLGATDKKQIRSLLRSAAPGASIVLSNGTVIKKSRRGGARAGAGRKRNRPAPNGQLGASNSSHDGERDTGDDSREPSHQDTDANRSFSSVLTQPLAT